MSQMPFLQSPATGEWLLAQLIAATAHGDDAVRQAAVVAMGKVREQAGLLPGALDVTSSGPLSRDELSQARELAERMRSPELLGAPAFSRQSIEQLGEHVCKSLISLREQAGRGPVFAQDAQPGVQRLESQLRVYTGAVGAVQHAITTGPAAAAVRAARTARPGARAA